MLVIFDLDDTLTPSKSSMDDEMALLISELLKKHTVAVVSGGDIKQFEKQFVSKLSNKNILMFPTNATKMYDGDMNLIYEETLENKPKIFDAFKLSCKGFGISWDKDILEDRGSQVTFSALGQDAPLELKSKWDPDVSKRKVIADRLRGLLPEFNITIGGTTSVDVTKKGIDKAYSLVKLYEMGFKKEDMLFIGDALFVGGNDYPMKEAGIRCVSVSSVEDTKSIIRGLI